MMMIVIGNTETGTFVLKKLIKMADQRPIGVFDSGLGGLSVLKALVEQLPSESFIYFADTHWCPYGNRKPSEVRQRSAAISRYLIGMDCKMIVVACNTATAIAIGQLRRSFNIPFIGIEPAIKQAALHTRSGKVGVLATRNTFRGKLYRNTSARFASDKDVMVQVGDGLVEIVEEGRMHTPEADALLRSYLQPMIAAGVDQIVLGCTHYPFLIPLMKSMVPETVVIHDPAPAVARQTYRVLADLGILSDRKSGDNQYYSSGNPEILNSLSLQLFGESRGAQQISI
jgi:glutamate racemase